MKIELFGKNYNPSESLVKVTNKKCEKIARRLKADEEATAKFTVTLEGDNYQTDLIVTSRGFEYRADVTGDDPFSNLDVVIPKVLAQIEKQKDIWGATKKGEPNKYPEEEDV